MKKKDKKDFKDALNVLLENIKPYFKRMHQLLGEYHEYQGFREQETADAILFNDKLRHRIPTMLCLLHSEISEALESFRTNDYNGFCEELADTFIRLLDIVDRLDIDLIEWVRLKMIKNLDRPFRHGNKKV